MADVDIAIIVGAAIGDENGFRQVWAPDFVVWEVDGEDNAILLPITGTQGR